MLNIEIAKSYKEGCYKVRIGNIEGCSEYINITADELIDEIKNAIEGLK